MKKILFTILTAAIFGNLQHAFAESQVFKWVDDNGKVHFSADKPAKTPSQALKIKNKPSSDASRLIEARDKRLKAASKPKQESSKQQSTGPKASKEDCAQANKNLSTLNSGIRVKRTNPDTGEFYYLDDEMRTKEEKENKEFVSKYCDPEEAS